MVVTEPIPERLAQIGWTSQAGLADRRQMLFYLRRTADDRIAIGGGGMAMVYGAGIAGRVLASQRLARGSPLTGSSGSSRSSRAYASRTPGAVPWT